MPQKQPVVIHWFRRDLRLEDNTALRAALQTGQPVLPIFIFDTDILARLENKKDRRVDFIHQVLSSLQEELTSLGSSLLVKIGSPKQVITALLQDYSVSAIYTNHDYEPYALQRDESIAALLNDKGLQLHTFKDQCVFEKAEVTKYDGKPYTVFTPFSNKWKKTLREEHYAARTCKPYYNHFFKSAPLPVPSLKSLGFEKTELSFSAPQVADEIIKHYKERRDYPAIQGTSRLSIHLRFGTVSARELVRRALPLSETWLNELIWREFYMQILWHFPHIVNKAFKPQYDAIPFRNNEADFKTWCEGKTGFPIVDAGMRELNTTGFMHNRVRMIVSSFLIKDLLIDWRWGEAYFAAQLNDFDLSANNGGWQWAASSGCDAAPYFRVFNPTEQQKKFDPDFKYIKKWIPEYGSANYPQPMLDHASARLRVLAVYKEALSDVKQLNLF
jgi:deoxyribodipyrimidine photo-lyase